MSKVQIQKKARLFMQWFSSPFEDGSGAFLLRWTMGAILTYANTIYRSFSSCGDIGRKAHVCVLALPSPQEWHTNVF